MDWRKVDGGKISVLLAIELIYKIPLSHGHLINADLFVWSRNIVCLPVQEECEALN